MTNFEKHKNRIIELLKLTDANVPAVVNGTLVKCEDVVHCAGCEFENTKYPDCDTCWIDFLEWVCKDDGGDCLSDASKPKTEEQGGCIGCKYEDRREGQYPCAVCTNCYTSKWEPRPKKTRQDEFLEHYPNAKRGLSSALDVCPNTIDTTHLCGGITMTCLECHKNYWLQEVEE